MFAYWFWLYGVSIINAKFLDDVVTLGPHQKDPMRWKYMSKFGYSVGDGKFALRIRSVRPVLTEPIKLSAEIYVDTKYHQAAATSDVCSRKNLSIRVLEVELPPNGEPSPWYNVTLSQTTRPHLWYFALSDCQESIQQYTRIRYEIEARQEDGDHFSHEQRGTLGVAFFKILVYGAFGVYFTFQCVKFSRLSDKLHPIILALVVALLLACISVCFTFTHLTSLYYEGVGIKVLDILSEVSSMVSSVIITTVLILIGLGYALLQHNLGDLDIVLPVAFLVCIIHVLLVGFSKIQDNSATKFHENDGICGWIMVAIRIGNLLWFVWAINSTMTDPSASTKVRRFSQKFLLVGGLYFVAQPVMFLVVQALPPYHRHWVMFSGLELIQLVSIFWLTRIFLTRGEFFHASTLSSTYLPGGHHFLSKTD